uniref:Large ribosomal subunit protein uL24c n=1 Tax=Polysiphonia scopulorum TaxID=257860 RepID=A0A1Z1MIR1_9FLOR|nr:ribosomal protein L24 [Polysiphonia scopulorum]ARW65641.1 ribosomal protein L24 [Polysiphonia scopulorum]
MKIKIKKGDNVEVRSGKEKGKQGKVISIIKNKEYIVIENINIKTKHIKPRQTDEKGTIKKIECPIHYSNIKLINKTIN